jgi:hypothetical protein
MYWRKFLISLYLAFIAPTSAYSQPLFGPKTYEDCILQNMKDVKSDDAAKAITSACAMKFTRKNDTPTKTTGVWVCRVYWDGWRFLPITQPLGPEFVVRELFKNGVKIVEVSIPKTMLEEFRRQQGGKMASFERFIKDRSDAIELACLMSPN